MFVFAPFSSMLIVKSGKTGLFSCGISKGAPSIGTILSGVAAAPTCSTVIIVSNPAFDWQDRSIKLNIRVGSKYGLYERDFIFKNNHTMILKLKIFLVAKKEVYIDSNL